MTEKATFAGRWISIPDQVRTINAIAGKPVSLDRTNLLKQIDIIQSELNETRNAVLAGDLVELRDGVADVEFTSLGLYGFTPFDYLTDMGTVCQSNLDKFDTQIADAEITREKYAAIGIETYVDTVEDLGKVLYVTKSAADQVDAKGKVYPKGKWLKSHSWKEPEFIVQTGMITFEKQFEAPIDPDVLNDQTARAVVQNLLERFGGQAVLDAIKLSKLAPQLELPEPKVLMTQQSPNGWKLEELMQQLVDEITLKNEVTKARFEIIDIATQLDISNLELNLPDEEKLRLQVIFENNRKLIEAFSACRQAQIETLEQLAALPQVAQ